MAIDAFLKLSTIEGESTHQGFEKQIQILSFSFGGNQVTSVQGTGGSGSGRANLHPISVTKYMDKSSSKIWKAMITGQHIDTGTLSLVKAGGDSTMSKPFFTIELKEVFVTDYSASASSEVPTESISFSYNEIKEEYFQQDEKGNLTSTGKVTYDLKVHKTS